MNSEGSIAEVSNTNLVWNLPISLLIMVNCYCVIDTVLDI